MNAAAWIGAAAAAIAFFTLMGTVLVHIVKYSYDKGVTDQRLAAMEKAQGANTDIHSVVAALTSTVEALKDSIKRLDSALEKINGRIFGRET